jgi:hypothetical protein
MKRIAALLAASCAAWAWGQELPQGYTCCNLHYDGDWISDANWGASPMIPAGTPIKVISYSWNYRAFVEIDGKAMRIGHDYGRADEPMDRYVARLVSARDPRALIEGYPENVRAAIRQGRPIPGMTREQALIAVGYPATHQTKTLEAPVWHHWSSRTKRYEIHWNEKGTVEKVVGLQ